MAPYTIGSKNGVKSRDVSSCLCYVSCIVSFVGRLVSRPVVVIVNKDVPAAGCFPSKAPPTVPKRSKLPHSTIPQSTDLHSDYEVQCFFISNWITHTTSDSLVYPQINGEYILPTTINVGYLYEPTRDGHNLSGLAVMRLAEKHLRRDRVIPQTTSFNYFYERISCDPYDGGIAFIDLYQKRNVSVLMGPPCAEPADVVGRLAVPWNILLMSHGSNSEEFQGKHVYKTFARTSLFSPSQVARATALFIKHMGWTNVAIVERRGAEAASFLTLAMKGIFKELGINVPLHIKVDDDQKSLQKHLVEIKAKARIIVPIFSRSTYGSAEFLINAHMAGMTGPDYVYVFAEEEADRVFEDHWVAEKLNASATYMLQQAYKAVMVVKLSALGKGRAASFFLDIQREYGILFPDRPINDYEYKIYQPPLYDSVYTYGKALNISVATGIQYDDGVGLFNLLRWKRFPGAVAPVIFDQRVERAPTYVVESFDAFGNWTKLMDIDRERDNRTRTEFDDQTKAGQKIGFEDSLRDLKIAFTAASNSYAYLLTPVRAAYWRTKDNKRPADIPPCGFDGRLCTETNTMWYAVGGVSGVLAVFIILGWIYFVKKNRADGKNMKQAFIIDLERLRKMSGVGGASGTTGSAATTNTNTSGSGTGPSESDFSTFSKFSVGKFGFACYDGTPAHVECFKKLKHLNFDRTQLRKLNGFRHVMHENTAAFLGISLDGPNNLVVLWQYVSSRTLRDVLHNPDIKLDDDFMSTFLKGITQGLKYIHKSALDCHGCLTTQTCLVDSRMVVKFTSYGMTSVIKHLVENNFILLEKKFYEKYHMAPEVVLRLNAKMYFGSKEADMFSLAMLMYQIVTRRELYEDFILTPEEILEKVCSPTTTLMRPEIPSCVAINWGEPVRKSIVECWDHDPSARPLIDSVCKVIDKATKKFSGSIMEKMMDRMERYAANLEKLVTERTNEAKEQQRRAEALLMEMLPKSVAIRLQQGLTIEPESYDEATVLFTDIVGFTKLSSSSSAYEVITLLNQLYSAFDAQIERRDVYKVETIGDAYMVVSGVPNRTKAHVDEILLLTLALRDFVEQYRLPFGDKGKIQIRAGAHSGPVVSGVVGSKMPRFCLFGDTVNTASRMESTGCAMKIQVSKATKKLIAKGAKYEVFKRGEVDVKGKGNVTTYFVEWIGRGMPLELTPLPKKEAAPSPMMSPAPEHLPMPPPGRALGKGTPYPPVSSSLSPSQLPPIGAPPSFTDIMAKPVGMSKPPQFSTIHVKPSSDSGHDSSGM